MLILQRSALCYLSVAEPRRGWKSWPYRNCKSFAVPGSYVHEPPPFCWLTGPPALRAGFVSSVGPPMQDMAGGIFCPSWRLSGTQLLDPRTVLNPPRDGPVEIHLNTQWSTPFPVLAQPLSGPCPVPVLRSDARSSVPPSRMVPKGPRGTGVSVVVCSGECQLDMHNSGGFPSVTSLSPSSCPIYASISNSASMTGEPVRNL